MVKRRFLWAHAKRHMKCVAYAGSCAIDSMFEWAPETINLDSAQDCHRKVSVGCYYYLEEAVIYDLHCLDAVCIYNILN